MDNFSTYHYLERLCSLLRTELRQTGSAEGLQPIQTEALHYLARCNRYSDTAMGVTDYLGQTKGTVSQTLKVLEKKGLIRKTPDEKDGRVTHLQLTPAGTDYLQQTIPPHLFKQLEEKLSTKEQDELKAALKTLLSSLQTINGKERFGLCQDCRFHEKRPDGTYCGLTQQTLQEKEWQQICREYAASETTI